MSFDDDWLKNGLPQFHNGKDKTNARQMLERIGGPTGFKTDQRTSADGTVTTVQTKGDMPPQVSIERKEKTIEAQIKGLATNGVLRLAEYLPSGEDTLTTLQDWPDTDTIDEENAGEAYFVENFFLNGRKRQYGLMSGIRHWFFGEELGPLSWVYVPSKNSTCWKVTLSNMMDNLTGFTLSFEAMPKTSKVPPARTVAQVVNVSGPTPLQSEAVEHRWNTAKARIEDIAPNGERVIIVNSYPPILVDTQHPADVGPYSNDSGIIVGLMGRHIMGAVELQILGVPPNAVVYMTTICTGVEAAGTLVNTYNAAALLTISEYPVGTVDGGYNEVTSWTNLVVGLRYSPVEIDKVVVWRAVRVLQNLHETNIKTYRSYVVTPLDLFPTIASLEVFYDQSWELLVDQEEVTVRSWCESTCVGPAFATITENATFPVTYSLNGWNANPTKYTTVGSLGAAEFPAKADGVIGGVMGTHPGFEFLNPERPTLAGDETYGGYAYRHLLITHWRGILIYNPVIEHRPLMYGFALGTHRDYPLLLPGVTPQGLGFEDGLGDGLISFNAVKYANGVFGLQTIIIGRRFLWSPVMKTTRGPGIVYPACIGVREVGKLPVYSTVAANLAPAQALQPTGAIDYTGYEEVFARVTGLTEYPTKANEHTNHATGTSRYVNPKGVVDRENVVFVHYSK